MNSKSIRNRITLNKPQTALSLFAASVVIWLLSVYIQPGSFITSFMNIITRPVLIPLNYLPSAVLVVLGWLAFGNAFYGAVPAALLVPLLSYVNLLKVEGRDDAFVPADIGLIREALNSASSYSLNLHPWLVLIIVMLTALLVFLGIVTVSRRPRALTRAVTAAAVIVGFALTVRFVYSSKKLYNSLPSDEFSNIPVVFNTFGFNYCFLYNLNLYPVDKPDGYDRAEVEKWETELLPKTENGIKPHVIFVMGEAFSDLSNNDVFDYPTQADNPIYKFNLLKDSPQAVSGHIAVSNIAAGTANTEFDIMTGTPTNTISDNTTSSFRVVHGAMPSLATLFKANGYNSYFMHPGYSWFYNRASVYDYLGISDSVFSDSFTDPSDIKGGLVSDAAFLSRLKADFEARKSSPLFAYTVTIQNHQVYNYSKYGDTPTDIPLKTEISDRALEYLSVYLQGVRDTADMVYELAEYFDTLDEPVLLVFFGDHLPNLGENSLTYRELGLPVGETDSTESIISSYTTPFIIYANKNYCDTTDFEARKSELELPENGIINDIYLGSLAAELADATGFDAYFDCLSKARRELPVFREREKAYILPDGTYTDTLNAEQKQLIDKLHCWQYYRLKK